MILVQQVPRPGDGFESARRPPRHPGPREVRLRVEACGLCRSDDGVRRGSLEGLSYPRVPGHEVVGRIVETGADVEGWAVDDRVGLGWHGGHCGRCERCRQEDFTLCPERQVTGASFDGGLAEEMVAPATALARVPEDLDAAEAAPLLCAGLTAWNALRHSGARAGERVVIQGLGGVGHLGVQIARHLDLQPVVLSTSPDKEDLARELGAVQFLHGGGQAPAASLRAGGGARVALATAPDSAAVSKLLPLLDPDAVVMLVGIGSEPLQIPPMDLIGQRRGLRGWPSGHPDEATRFLEFALAKGIRPVVESHPLEKAEQAWQRLEQNRVRLRAVLIPSA